MTSNHSNNPSTPALPLAEARRLVKDLAEPNQGIYWADFLFSISLGWGAFIVTLSLPSWSPQQAVAFVVASLALYRSVLFIHELAHRKRGTFEGFRLVWSLLCGLPLMVPAFLYTRVHNDHHSLKTYGTTNDGEYVPFGAESPIHIVVFMALIVVLPVLFPLRFLVIAPLSMLHPKLRQRVWQRFSSLTIDFVYLRPPPAPWEGRSAGWEEFGAFLYCVVFATLFALGLLPWSVLLLWYLVVVMVFVLNSLRTLAAHAYRHRGGEPIGLESQFLDSVNVPGNALTELWAPLGLRYHATHHLFPTMPYHALGMAHRRLRDQLSDTTAYLRSSRDGLWDAVSRLWRDARAASRF